MKKKIILLDAGHGGRDPGTVHEHPMITVVEKELNLQIALYTRRYIQKHYHNEIITLMTRLFDNAMSLKDRCSMADEVEADLFLSIHCNSRGDAGKYGVEIETFYYLDPPDKELALTVQNVLVNGLSEAQTEMPIIYRRVAQANYYVLRHTNNIPSALVECGFLCDQEEALFLSKESTQRMYGKYLGKAIEQFLYK